MLFPSDFWLSFALLVGGGMVASFLLAALTSRVQPRGGRAGVAPAVDEVRPVVASEVEQRESGLGVRVRAERSAEAVAASDPVMSGAGAGV